MLSYLKEGVKKRGPGYEQHELSDSGKQGKSSAQPMPVERPVTATVASQPLSIPTGNVQPFSTPPLPGSLLANFLAFDLVAQEKARAKDKESITVPQASPALIIQNSPVRASPFSAWQIPSATPAVAVEMPMSPPRASFLSLPTLVTTPPAAGYSSRAPNPSSPATPAAASQYTLAASGTFPITSPPVEPIEDRKYASLAASAYDSENVLKDLSLEEQRKLMASSPPKDMGFHSHVLSGTWNERFQNLLESPIKTPKDCEKRVQLLQTLIDEFVMEARGNVETIIKELHLPLAKKTIPPMNEKAGFMGGAKYIYNGLFYKFAMDHYNFFGGEDAACKVAGHELAAFNELVACQVNQLHVPLISLFTYGGYRVIVTCILPIDEHTLHFGSADGGRSIKGLPFNDDLQAAFCVPIPVGSRSCTVHTKAISELLLKVCEKLNLKPHGGVERSSGAVKWMFGPTDMEVHRGRDGRYYIIDTSRLFPPERPNNTRQLGDKRKQSHLYCLLRPEFVRQFCVPLSSDGFCGMGDHQKEMHNAELTLATRELKSQVIPAFCKMLLSSSAWSVDIGTMSVLYNQNRGSNLDKLKEQLQRAGINCRYLGYVWEAIPVEQKSLRCKILVEMIARIARKVLFAEMRKVSMHDTEDFHLMVANFFTNVLFPMQRTENDWWESTIERNLLSYFELSSSLSDARSFLRGTQRHQYIWLLCQRLQELTGVKLRDEVNSRLRRFESNPLVHANGIPLTPSLSYSNITPVTSPVKVTMSSASSSGSSVNTSPSQMSPASSGHAIPVLPSFTGEDIESVSMLVKPMRITAFNYSADTFRQAEEFYLQELKQREEALGPNHVQNLVDLYVAAGDGQESKAEPILLRISAILKTNHGEESQESARGVLALAKYYSYFSRFAEAAVYLNMALKVNERLSLQAPIAKNCIALAHIKRQFSQLGEAVALLRRALEIRKKLYGDSDSKVAKVLGHLASYYRLQKRKADATRAGEEAKKIYKANWGDQHFRVAAVNCTNEKQPTNLRLVVDTLGRILMDDRKWSKACKLLKEALAVQQQALGEQHPDAAQTLEALGNLHRESGQLSDAETCFLRALSIYRVRLGEHNIKVGILLSKLAYLYWTENKLEAVRDLLQRSVEVKMRALGETLETAKTIQDLGEAMLELGQYAESVERLRAALVIRRAHKGSPESVAENLCLLARACGKQNMFEEVFQFLDEATRINDAHPSRRVTELLTDGV